MSERELTMSAQGEQMKNISIKRISKISLVLAGLFLIGQACSSQTPPTTVSGFQQYDSFGNPINSNGGRGGGGSGGLTGGGLNGGSSNNIPQVSLLDGSWSSCTQAVDQTYGPYYQYKKIQISGGSANPDGVSTTGNIQVTTGSSSASDNQCATIYNLTTTQGTLRLSASPSQSTTQAQADFVLNGQSAYTTLQYSGGNSFYLAAFSSSPSTRSTQIDTNSPYNLVGN
jgi:hypothetical protein